MVPTPSTPREHPGEAEVGERRRSLVEEPEAEAIESDGTAPMAREDTETREGWRTRRGGGDGVNLFYYVETYWGSTEDDQDDEAEELARRMRMQQKTKEKGDYWMVDMPQGPH